MSLERRLDLRSQLSAITSLEDGRAQVVAVGDREEWIREGHRLPISGELLFASFSDITPSFISTHQPAVVVSPVLARSFDCIDLARELHAMGYQGSYRAVSGEVPSPEMIEREIKQLCPGLDFGVIVAL